jgi:hypothetical protein
MDAKYSLKAAVNFNLRTRLHIPGDSNDKSHPSRTLKSRAQEQNLNKISRVTAPALRDVKVLGSSLCSRSSLLTTGITLPHSFKKHGDIILKH